MTARPLETVLDLTAIQQLASRRWPQGWHPGGLGWWLARWRLDDQPSTGIAIVDSAGTDGRIAAWATRGQHDEGEVSVQGDAAQRQATADALDWCLGSLDHVEVRIEVFDGDEVLEAALAERGFTPQPADPVVGMFRRATSAAEGGFGGYVVRPVDDTELNERVEVHRRSWKPSTLPWADGRAVDPDAESSFTRAAYDAVRGTWLYRQDLDLVAEAPDGSLAACCIAWLDPATGVAEIEPVGVDPDHRRRGLAVALCHEVGRRVAELGGEELFLNVAPSEAYPANAAAYAKAGFEVRRRGAHHVRAPLPT